MVQNPVDTSKGNKSKENNQLVRLKLRTTTSRGQDKQAHAILKQEWQADTVLEILKRIESKCKIPKIL